MSKEEFLKQSAELDYIQLKRLIGRELNSATGAYRVFLDDLEMYLDRGIIYNGVTLAEAKPFAESMVKQGLWADSALVAFQSLS